MFAALMHSEKMFFNPKPFFFSMTEVDGQPLNPNEQKDADEYFARYMELLEDLIKGSSQEKHIANIFTGIFANEIICIGCPHYSEREEPFLVLSV